MNENIESAIKEVAESVFFHFTDQSNKERLQSALTKFTRTILPLADESPKEDGEDELWNDWDAAKSQFDEFTMQQPIPQDINIEIENYCVNHFHTVDGIVSNALKDFTKQFLLPQLQAQQSQIEELEKSHHEEKLNWVRQFDDEINKQAAEIESLKKENETFKDGYVERNDVANYWKQRCEAAENIINNNDLWANTIEWEAWQTLKQQIQ